MSPTVLKTNAGKFNKTSPPVLKIPPPSLAVKSVRLLSPTDLLYSSISSVSWKLFSINPLAKLTPYSAPNELMSCSYVSTKLFLPSFKLSALDFKVFNLFVKLLYKSAEAWVAIIGLPLSKLKVEFILSCVALASDFIGSYCLS